MWRAVTAMKIARGPPEARGAGRFAARALPTLRGMSDPHDRPPLSDQPHAWSDAAAGYEGEFVDPHHDAPNSPLLGALAAVPDAAAKTAADLGCGIGPLLPHLAARFGRVVGVDFAPGMLDRARQRCRGLANVELKLGALADAAELCGPLDVAVAVNSLVQPTVGEVEAALVGIRRALLPGGLFLGIVPAMDAVHYHTLLLLDRARAAGLPDDRARQNAAHHAEHHLFGFAFSDFRFRGLRQHFWHPFEIAYRLRRAGFRRVRKAKARLSWSQFACGGELARHPAPWDWFFRAEA